MIEFDLASQILRAKFLMQDNQGTAPDAFLKALVNRWGTPRRLVGRILTLRNIGGSMVEFLYERSDQAVRRSEHLYFAMHHGKISKQLSLQLWQESDLRQRTEAVTSHLATLQAVGVPESEIQEVFDWLRDPDTDNRNSTKSLAISSWKEIPVELLSAIALDPTHQYRYDTLWNSALPLPELSELLRDAQERGLGNLYALACILGKRHDLSEDERVGLEAYLRENAKDDVHVLAELVRSEEEAQTLWDQAPDRQKRYVGQTSYLPRSIIQQALDQTLNLSRAEFDHDVEQVVFYRKDVPLSEKVDAYVNGSFEGRGYAQTHRLSAIAYVDDLDEDSFRRCFRAAVENHPPTLDEYLFHPLLSFADVRAAIPHAPQKDRALAAAMLHRDCPMDLRLAYLAELDGDGHDLETFIRLLHKDEFDAYIEENHPALIGLPNEWVVEAICAQEGSREKT